MPTLLEKKTQLITESSCWTFTTLCIKFLYAVGMCDNNQLRNFKLSLLFVVLLW